MKSTVSPSSCSRLSARALRKHARLSWCVAPLLGATLALAPSLAPSLAAQEPFEGVITMRIAPPRPAGAPAGASAGATPGGLQEVEYLVRGPSLRINLSGPAASMALLVSSREKKSWMLMPAQRRYAEITFDTIASGSAARSASAGSTVTRSGKNEVVAGTRCEVYRAVTPRDTTDVCVARGMGRFMNPLASLRGAAEQPWQRALLEGDGFPLKVSRPDGTVTLEVTRIERKRLATDLFAIPLDWQKMDMPRRPPGGG